METCLECVSEDWLGRGSGKTLLGWWGPFWGGGDTSGIVETLPGWWKLFWGGGNTSRIMETLLGWWRPSWDDVKHVFFLLFLSCYSPSLPFPLLP